MRNMTGIVCFVYFLAAIITVSIIITEAMYNKSFSGLTTFPHDIPLDQSIISLQGNLIRDIDYVDDFTN